MGEAKRREELGLPPREKIKEKQTSKNKLNKILNKYPYLPFILGFSLLAILIIDLVNYYKQIYKKGDTFSRREDYLRNCEIIFP